MDLLPVIDMLPVIDILREAQVLAPHSLPEYEAEACARLAALYHRFPAVCNAAREPRYNGVAFAFLQTIELQLMADVDCLNGTLLVHTYTER
ncbi:unnamed protein product [Agarophyton chilense]